MAPRAATGSSSEASAIVAEPTTLTGSIGVFGGKFAVGPALARFGVDVRQLGVGSPYAGAFGMGQEFTPAAARGLRRAGWTASTTTSSPGWPTGRKLPVERVREIAKGHVWTGVQAKRAGPGRRARRLLRGGRQGQGAGRHHRRGAAEAHDALRLAVRGAAEDAGRLGRPRPGPWRPRPGCSAIPARQGMMDELAQARLRSQGAMVLAPTPIH